MTSEDSWPYSPTAGLPFDDEELESKLVWIWGSPRSGSTWLLEMLCDPLAIDQRSRLGFKWRPGWRGEPAAIPVNEFQISGHLGAGVYGGSGRSDAVETEDGELLPRTLNRETSSFSSYAFSAAYEDVWRPEARRLTLVRLYAVLERARQAGLELPPDLPLLVIKEVNGSHAADLVMSLFPRSRMIFVLRDGRDVIDSILDANGPNGWLTRWRGDEDAYEGREDRLALVRESCRTWVARMNVCTQAYEAHDPALRRRIRYEDLRLDTAECLGDLARWLGLPGGPRRMESIAQSHSFEAAPERSTGPGMIQRSATPGGWRNGLTSEEQELAQQVMGRQLAKLGYESRPKPAA